MVAGGTGAGKPLRVLLVGYNGANNTGAEALLTADIEDLRAVFGKNAVLTVPTLNAANLRRYLSEGPGLKIAPIPPLFFLAVWRLVRASDLVVLVEGSTYMDTWTSALLWFFLWATECARWLGKPCLAYAVDAGELSPFNRRLTRHAANRTDLIVTRTRAAEDRLRALGVTAPMEATADNALNFVPDPAEAGWLAGVWPQARGLVGLAVVDFFQFPVVVRPFGRAEDRYRWPYHFARSPERTRAAARLAESYADLADEIVERYGRSIALICMEQLDEPLARAVLERMVHRDSARIFSAREHNASRMTLLLRRLDLLVTSRYHAAVLSLAGAVPQIALGHDLRLATLYRELGLYDTYFHTAETPRLADDLAGHVAELLTRPEGQRRLLRLGFAEHLDKARRNRVLLREFAELHGWVGLGVTA